MLSYASSRDNFQVYVVPMSTIKRFFAWDLIGGSAFLLIGKMIFSSDLLCIACNIIATQMLHYLLPAASA